MMDVEQVVAVLMIAQQINVLMLSILCYLHDVGAIISKVLVFNVTFPLRYLGLQAVSCIAPFSHHRSALWIR